MPRTLDYEVLRSCERLSISTHQFDSLPYDEQLRLLSYNRIRIIEESHN
ncbi:MAG: hypothetical protein KDA69_08835 [Planctomycetaceae bacterium]|nr:hypothetical protein [Planctomycetaceae bacterium]